VAGLAAPLVCFRVGAGQGARLLLTGQTVTAVEAHRLGLFHELTPPDTVWARAMQVANDCAAGAPEAIQLTKRLLNETLGEN
jgi:methylglutaconyl-CoA hydratase